MTLEELRSHSEYAVCMDKIRGYKKGFQFTLNWQSIPTAKANALKIIIKDAIKDGLIEHIADGWSLDMINTDSTYRRI